MLPGALLDLNQTLQGRPLAGDGFFTGDKAIAREGNVGIRCQQALRRTRLLGNRQRRTDGGHQPVRALGDVGAPQRRGIDDIDLEILAGQAAGFQIGVDEGRPWACREHHHALAAEVGDLRHRRILIDQDAQIGAALEGGDRPDGGALGARRSDQSDLHLADIGLPGVDELDRVAGTAAVLDIDVELGLLEPALVLRQMHRRLHAPGREIEPYR